MQYTKHFFETLRQAAQNKDRTTSLSIKLRFMLEKPEPETRKTRNKRKLH